MIMIAIRNDKILTHTLQAFTLHKLSYRSFEVMEVCEEELLFTEEETKKTP